MTIRIPAFIVVTLNELQYDGTRVTYPGFRLQVRHIVSYLPARGGGVTGSAVETTNGESYIVTETVEEIDDLIIRALRP